MYAASGNTLIVEVKRSRLLVVGVAVVHVALTAIIIARWQLTYLVGLWSPLMALASFLWADRRLLTPGRGRMPRRVMVTREGQWSLDGELGYPKSAWVHPLLCRVVISRVGDGTRTLWLARDAVEAETYWRLRRLLLRVRSLPG